MNAHRPLPITQDLVLLGGGHAHALVLKKWAMAPLPGARVTLINPDVKAPYTGMLPGFVAGHYQRGELDIDLVKLARQANARLIVDRAIGIDLSQRRVNRANGPDLAYDVLSVDIGITSQLPDLPGAETHIIPAKPLGVFSRAWNALIHSIPTKSEPVEAAVLGGGVAGAELALAMAHRLKNTSNDTGAIRIIEAGSEVLRELKPSARKVLLRDLDEAGIDIVLNAQAERVSGQGVHINGASDIIPANFIVSAAGARPHAWLEQTDLPLEAGYIAVDQHLRTLSDPNVFAAGDCAHLTHAPRPKAGVFAVRQAPVLYHNLRVSLSEGRLQSYRPQRDYLKLISRGRQSAVTDKWGIGLSGDWVWLLKDRIDRKFMDQFREPLQMPSQDLPSEIARGVRPLVEANNNPCGACGAKVAQAPLLAGLEAQADALDDAAIQKMGDHFQVLSTDHLRAFNADAYLLAKVAATHALGDIWSMGAAPESALSQIILPPLGPDQQANMLGEIMTGAREVMEASGAKIVGGHTSSGTELSIGFTVTGRSAKPPISQAGAQVGDVLILTKPIGTGVILAAEMRQQVDGDDYQVCLETMLRSQSLASQLLAGSATAMTDVTGYGLAGHLLNILTASKVEAELDISEVPILPGALALSRAGVRSTLWSSNASQSSRVEIPYGARRDLLFDPQTCGGLLATIPKTALKDTMESFKREGEPIWVIGRMTSGAPVIRPASSAIQT